jgi:glycine cleavage system transcriptional repressor
MHKDYVINVMSVDRVGIISDLSEAILELGGSIEAISQTVVQGYFTVIVTARFDRALDSDEVAAAVRKKGTRGELAVLVKPREPTAARPVVADAERFILTVTGPDRKGIIHRICSYLASRNVNIEDLYAALEGKQFLLIAQLQVPPGLDIERMQLDVQGLWPHSDVRVSLQHENIFLATSNVDFSHRAKAPVAR